MPSHGLEQSQDITVQGQTLSCVNSSPDLESNCLYTLEREGEELANTKDIVCVVEKDDFQVVQWKRPIEQPRLRGNDEEGFVFIDWEDVVVFGDIPDEEIMEKTPSAEKNANKS